jgi:hypothetical protein
MVLEAMSPPGLTIRSFRPQRRGGVHRSALAAAAVLLILFGGAGSSDTVNPDIPRFIHGAFITYETSFATPVSPARWSRLFDNLFLMGKLWEAYGFSPRYRISSAGGVYHVVDPTGIEGTLRTLESGATGRIMLANGRMRNWYIPVALSGRVLFVFRYDGAPGSGVMRVTVYGEGSDNPLEQAALKALAPVLRMYIGRRITRNIGDLNRMLADMDSDPVRVRGMLGGADLASFDRMVK